MGDSKSWKKREEKIEMKILLFKGGETEREVSLMTAKNVSNSLKHLGHSVEEIDTKSNNLLSYTYKGIDLIFNALHGGIGENGCLQGFLDTIKIPYTGSGVMASSLAMNKIISKMLFAKFDINVAADKIVNIKEIMEKDPMSRPYVLKPIEGGSSIDVVIIDKNFDMKKLSLSESGSKFFAEKFIAGREFSVAVIGDEILGIIEIKFNESFYNYKAKYKDSKTFFNFPNDMKIELKDKLEEYSLKAHRSLGCKGLTRADFIIPNSHPIDPVLLEINTLPGLTTHSLVPKIAQNKGLSYDDLIAKIIDEAII